MNESRTGRFPARPPAAAAVLALALIAFSGCERFEAERENERALAALALGRTDEAAAILEAACREAPDTPVLWRNLAAVYQARNDPQQALAALRRAYELVPNDGTLRRDVARLAFAAGDYEGVTRLYDHPGVVRDATEDYLVPGLAAQRLGRTEGARLVFGRGIEQFPDSYALRLAHASALADAGEFPAAIAEAKRAQQAAPEEAGAYVLLGSIFLASGDADGVEETLGLLEHLPTRDPVERVQLGYLYLQLGRYSQAENQFRWALDQAPRSTEARLGRALALYHQQRFNEALEACQELAAEAPQMTPPYTLTGYIYAARQQRIKAIETLRAALERDPNQPAVRTLLERLQAPASATEEEALGEGDDPRP